MQALVLDTTVLVVANGQSTHATLDCVEASVGCLWAARKGVVVIDDDYLILTEYRSNVSERGQPGQGDAFLLWLFRNMWRSERCEQVAITPHPDRGFVEFPNDDGLKTFDPSDRKFVATALASKREPELANSADRGWKRHEKSLTRNGVRLRFLCR
jgi:hypothetical protein